MSERSPVPERRRSTPAPATTRPATVLIFWDYDTQWGADRSRSPGGPKRWGALEFGNTERLLELHAEFDVPACFAVVGAAALPGARPYHDPAQVRRIAGAGHEVASHSMRHEWLPALSGAALRETLGRSREVLEQVTGTEVVSFIPPFNQPFDHPPGWSFSLSERRAVRRGRTDVATLCGALRETGYRFCRIAYRPLAQRLAERALRRDIERPARLERIAGVTCARLNTPGGFDAAARAHVERGLRAGGLWILYGHPHSISSRGTPQSIDAVVRTLEQLVAWRREGRVRCVRPRDLLREATEPPARPDARPDAHAAGPAAARQALEEVS